MDTFESRKESSFEGAGTVIPRPLLLPAPFLFFPPFPPPPNSAPHFPFYPILPAAGIFPFPFGGPQPTGIVPERPAQFGTFKLPKTEPLSPGQEKRKPRPRKPKKETGKRKRESDRQKALRGQRLISEEFKQAAKKRCAGNFIQFGESFVPWNVSLSSLYFNNKTKEGFENLVQGYHSPCGRDFVIVYEGRGVKRLGQLIKEKLNFIEREATAKPYDEELVFKPTKITTPEIWKTPIFGEIYKFLQDLPFDYRGKTFKAQGEHLSNYFKIFVAEESDFADYRADFLEALSRKEKQKQKEKEKEKEKDPNPPVWISDDQNEKK